MARVPEALSVNPVAVSLSLPLSGNRVTRSTNSPFIILLFSRPDTFAPSGVVIDCNPIWGEQP